MKRMTKYSYFQIVQDAYNEIFREYSKPIREDFNKNSLIDEKIKYIIETEYNTIEELCQDVLKLYGDILLLQPFEDGNHRTALKTVQIILSKKGYNLRIDIISDIKCNRINMPYFYELDEYIEPERIEAFSKYIEEMPNLQRDY